MSALRELRISTTFLLFSLQIHHKNNFIASQIVQSSDFLLKKQASIPPLQHSKLDCSDVIPCDVIKHTLIANKLFIEKMCS